MRRQQQNLRETTMYFFDNNPILMHTEFKVQEPSIGKKNLFCRKDIQHSSSRDMLTIEKSQELEPKKE